MEKNGAKDKNDGGFIFPLLVIIAIVLLAVFGVCVALAVYFSDFTIIDYISVTSSFSVAILTVIYVYASTKQMHVMKLQLDEMKTEHLLKDHPILVLDRPKLIIESPRFFYSPPEDRFSFQSRYFFTASLANASDDPAVIVNVVARMIIPHEPEDIILYSLNHKSNLVSAKEKQKDVSLMFLYDLDGKMFNALRERSIIKIETVIYYQNITGACFATYNTYRFSIGSLDHAKNIIDNTGEQPNKIEIPDIIRNWHTLIVQAPTKYKEQLMRLESTVHDREQRKIYESTFNDVREDFQSTCISRKNMDCHVYEESNRFKIQTISMEEFTKGSDNSINLKMILATSSAK